MAEPKIKLVEEKKSYPAVKMFRCYRDPHIPPRPQNAFTIGDGPGQLRGQAFATPIGVHIKAIYKDGNREFLIPYPNIECIEFLSES